MARVMLETAARSLAFVSILCGLWGAAATFADDPPGLRVAVVAEGLWTPWCLGFLPVGRMLVTERSGQVRVVSREGSVS